MYPDGLVPRPLNAVKQSRPQGSYTLLLSRPPLRNAALALSFRYPVEQIVLKIYNAPNLEAYRYLRKFIQKAAAALKLVNTETRNGRRQGKDNRLQTMINRYARAERDVGITRKQGEGWRGRIRRGLTVKRVMEGLPLAVKRIKDERRQDLHEIQQNSPSDTL